MSDGLATTVKKEPGSDRGGSSSRNNRRSRRSNNNQPTIAKFKGETTDLEGFIYDIGTPSQAEQFSKTTIKVANYAGRTLKHSQDIRQAIETLKETTFTAPTRPATIGDSEIDKMILTRLVDEFVKKQSAYQQNKEVMFSVVLGQCPPAMKTKLIGESTYKDIKARSDVVGLLLLIRAAAYEYESQRYPHLAIHASMTAYYTHKQKYYTTCDDYLKSYESHQDVVRHCGGRIGEHDAIVEYHLKMAGKTFESATLSEKEAAATEGRDAYEAMAFLAGLNPDRYQDLLNELANAFNAGRDEYPKTLTDAHKYVTSWIGSRRQPGAGRTSDAVAFVTQEDAPEKKEEGQSHATDGVLRRRNGTPVECYICGGNHLKPDCPNSPESKGQKSNNPESKGQKPSSGSKKSEEAESANLTFGNWNEDSYGKDFDGVVFMHTDHLMEQAEDGRIKKSWTLLDNQSTVDIFSNKALLRNIQKVDIPLKIYSTGGSTTTDLIGFLPGYGWVWFYEKGIANILSLSRVKKKFRVTFDSADRNEFQVHLADGRKRIFKESKKGLYYSDMLATESSTVLVNTVDYNKSKYSSRDCSRAVNARKLQYIIGGPSYDHFRQILRSNQLKNCPVIEEDIVAAEDIFGKSLMCLKGKTTRQSTPHARVPLMKLPYEIVERYQDVQLVGDVMSINGIRFVITKSRHIKFTTVQFIPNAKVQTLLDSIIKVDNIYRTRGFRVKTLLVDGQFACLEEGLIGKRNITLNTCSNDEHVIEIERMIRTVKE